MKCYNCKAEIEADSWFCDQCGQEIFICPACHTPGRGEGKRCGMCGTPLVSAKSLATSGSDDKPTKGTGAPTSKGWNGGESGPQPSTTSGSEAPTKLVCHAENITLELKDGALIGRVDGDYRDQLGRLMYISSRHATLRKERDHWIITDVGSRNGTAVNGKWCYTPLPFRRGDVVRIANSYDFIAE